MSILIYCLASLSIVLAIGGLVSFGQSRHIGLLLSSVISIFFSGLAIHNVEWWPLIVGFIANWGLRLIGADPGNRRHTAHSGRESGQVDAVDGQRIGSC